MSDTSKILGTSTHDVGGAPTTFLQILHDDKKYALGKDGKLFKLKGGALEEVTGGKFKDVLKTAGQEIKELRGKEPAVKIGSDVQELLRERLKHFSKNDILKDEVVNGVKNELDVAKKIRDDVTGVADKEVFAKDTFKRLAHEPGAENFLNKKTIKHMVDSDFSWQRLEAFGNAEKEFKGLIKSASNQTDFEKSMKDLLTRYHGDVNELALKSEDRIALGKKGLSVKLDTLRTEVAEKIGKDTKLAKKAGEGIETALKDIEREKKATKPDLKQLETWNKEVADKTAELQKLITKDSHGAAVAKDLSLKHPDLLKNLGELDGAKGIVAHIEGASKSTSAIGDAVKKGGGFFVHSLEKQELIAKEKNIAVSELKGWSKLNTKGKAAIVAGVAAITYAIVAAVGSKGKNQQQVIEGRNSEQEMAPAR